MRHADWSERRAQRRFVFDRQMTGALDPFLWPDETAPSNGMAQCGHVPKYSRHFRVGDGTL